MAATDNYALPYPVLDDPADVPADMQELAEKLDTMGFVPAGAMFLWPGPAAPAGFFLLIGQQVPEAANPTLAGLFGAAGGQVTLPNLRDRIPLGAGARALLTTGGAAEIALTTGQLPAHAHAAGSYTAPARQTAGADRSLDHNHIGPGGYTLLVMPRDIGEPGIATAGAGGAVAVLTAPRLVDDVTISATTGQADRSIDHTHSAPAGSVSGNSSNAGAGETHPNLPPFLVVNYIIRAG